MYAPGGWYVCDGCGYKRQGPKADGPRGWPDGFYAGTTAGKHYCGDCRLMPARRPVVARYLSTPEKVLYD